MKRTRLSFWKSGSRVTKRSDIETESAEAEALQRLASGDLDAFERVFRRYQSDVYRWIVQLVRDPAVAEELTVETFWRVYRSRKRFDARRPFQPWVRRIAVRLAIDHLRKADLSLPSTVAPVSSSDPDPLLRTELQTAIQQAFHALPVKLRVAAALALIEELPHREIADTLNLSLSAVKMRVARALRLLRKNLQKRGYDHERK